MYYQKNQDNNKKQNNYLTSEKSKKLLMEIYKKRLEIENMDFRLKALILESLHVAHFEVLLLSGYNILSLYSKCHTEDDKTALVKAYYNLSNSLFRQNSSYFNNEKDALNYKNIVHNKEIKQRILKLKK